MNKYKIISFKEITSLQLSMMICLPTIYIGFFTKTLFNFNSTILATISTGLIMFLLYIIMFFVSKDHPKKSTIEIASDVFSKSGLLLSILGMLITAIGWFALQINMVIGAITPFLKINESILILIISALIIFIVFNGITSIEKLTSIMAIPFSICIFFLIYKFWNTSFFYITDVITKNTSSGFFIPFSIILSSMINISFDMPVYYRYIKSFWTVFSMALIINLISFPIITFTGIIIASNNISPDFYDSIFSLSENYLIKILISILIFISVIPMNSGNLFSASTVLSSIGNFFKISYKKSVLILGIIGTTLAMCKFINNLVQYIDIICIIITSFGTIMIINFLFIKLIEKYKISYQNKINSIVLFSSSIFGILSFLKFFEITKFAFLDAMGFTAILYIILLVINIIVKGNFFYGFSKN